METPRSCHCDYKRLKITCVSQDVQKAQVLAHLDDMHADTQKGIFFGY